MRSRRLSGPRAWLLAAVLPLVSACSSPGGTEEDAVADAGPDRGGDAAADAVEILPDDAVPEDVKYPGEAGAVGSFTETRTSFYDQPFPCNCRRQANGRPDLADFPNPGKIELLDQYKQVAQAKLSGFSPSAAIYFRFDAPLDPKEFPYAAETTKLDSSVLLVNVTKGSAFYGTLVPVQIEYWGEPAPEPGWFVEPYLLEVRPYGGFPMRGGETYACLVTRGLVDAAGKHVGPSPLVRQALATPAGGPFADLFAPLAQWLGETSGIGLTDIAAATVFTTDDPVKELALAAKFEMEEAVITPAGPVEKLNAGQNYTVLKGKYTAPNFMTGDPPYDSGGDMLFTADGKPQVQWTETLYFALSVPSGTMPASGWPVVVYAHGTGGSKTSFVSEGVAKDYATEGIAVISIDQPLHGDRYTGPDVNVEVYSFNFMNPHAGRTLFRQSALDNIGLRRFISSYEFSYQGKEHRFDPDAVGYFGHSQGGITGALSVALDEGLKAAVLSGAGGGLAWTILLRKQLDSGTAMDIKEMLETMLGLQPGELNLFHPVLTLAQMMVDVADPLNYGPYYLYPRLRKDPLNILVTEGLKDPYTPPVTTENLALSAGIPQIKPVAQSNLGFSLLGLDQYTRPLLLNLTLPDGTKATAGLAQFPNDGHFAAFDNPGCITMRVGLLSSALKGGTPKIP